MEIPVLNSKGEEIAKMDLLEKIFNAEVNPYLIHEVIKAYISNQHKKTAATKTRAEVRGGGRKPWRQKHTGRARAGSIRSPLWKGGGVIFGPKPHSYRVDLPTKKKKKALICSLSEKFKSDGILVVDAIPLQQPKTKIIYQFLKNFALNDKKVIILTDEYNPSLWRACRNLPKTEIKLVQHLNTYDILWAEKLLFLKDAIKKLETFIA